MILRGRRARTDGRRVETTTSEPFDKSKPPERLIQNPDLDPKAKILVQDGSDGFSVEVTRTVYRNDEVVRSERYTTVYRPYPKIYAVGLEVPGGEAEPKDWTIEMVDEAPNLHGSPGLYGHASDAEIYLDILEVTANK